MYKLVKIIPYTFSSTCALTLGESLCSLQIFSYFKYQGVYLLSDHTYKLNMNVDPLLALYKSKFKTSSSLLLSIADRINLIKIIVLPKCLYLRQHSSLSIPKVFFHRLESLMVGFILGRARHKLHLSTLQRPKHLGGGDALPDLFLYYVAGQLRLLRRWFTDASLPSSEAHLAHSLEISNMRSLLKYPHLYNAKLLPIRWLANKVWKHSKTLTCFNDIVADMSLRHNLGLSELLSLSDIQVWESRGVTKFHDLYDDNVFVYFEQL